MLVFRYPTLKYNKWPKCFQGKKQSNFKKKYIHYIVQSPRGTHKYMYTWAENIWSLLVEKRFNSMFHLHLVFLITEEWRYERNVLSNNCRKNTSHCTETTFSIDQRNFLKRMLCKMNTRGSVCFEKYHLWYFNKIIVTFQHFQKTGFKKKNALTL